MLGIYTLNEIQEPFTSLVTFEFTNTSHLLLSTSLINKFKSKLPPQCAYKIRLLSVSMFSNIRSQNRSKFDFPSLKSPSTLKKRV